MDGTYGELLLHFAHQVAINRVTKDPCFLYLKAKGEVTETFQLPSLQTTLQLALNIGG